MEKSPCFIDFKNTVKDLMTESDARALIELVKERADARRTRRLEPQAIALNRTVEEVIAQIDARNALKEIEYRNNALKHVYGDKFMQPFKEDWSRGIGAFTYGIESNLPNSRLSASNAYHSRIADILSYLHMKLHENGVSETFNDKRLDRLNALARAGIKVDDPRAMKVGKAIQDVYRYAAKQANMHGASMTEEQIDEYVARTVHNIERLKSPTGKWSSDWALRLRLLTKYKGDFQKVHDELTETAYQRWFKTIRPLTDDDRTLEHVPRTEKDENKFFRSFYQAVTTGVRKLPYTDEGNPVLTNLRRSFNIAQKLRAERVWHPKGAAEWLDYNKKYGYDSFHDATIAQLEQLGAAIGTMEKAGTNPRAFFNRFITKYERLARDQNKVGANKRIKRAKNFVDYLMHDLSQPMAGLATRIIKAVRTLPFYRLGMLALRSQPDINTMGSALSRWGIPYLATVGQAYKDFFKGIGKAERKELAIRLGLYSDGTFLNILNRWGTTDSLRGIWARMLRWQDKYSMINRFDNMNRYTMGSMLSNKLASELEKNFEELQPNTKILLGQYGIDKKLWEVLQTAKGKLFKDQYGKYLTQDVAHDISDADIATKYYGNKLPKVSETKALAARHDIYTKLLNLYQDQTLYGKTFPTVADRALMQAGIRSNTLPGELWKTVLLFRHFAFANMRRTLGRFIYSGGAESLYDALVNGKIDYKGLTKYMVGSLPFGYMSYTAANLMSGLSPPDILDPKTFLISMIGGGGMFFVGDTMEDLFRSQGDIVKTFGGRGISMWVDFGKFLHDEIWGKGNTPERAFVRMIQHNLPLGNMLFIKPIIERGIFDQIYQQLDPMYKYKLERRLDKENVHLLHLGG